MPWMFGAEIPADELSHGKKNAVRTDIARVASALTAHLPNLRSLVKLHLLVVKLHLPVVKRHLPVAKPCLLMAKRHPPVVKRHLPAAKPCLPAAKLHPPVVKPPPGVAKPFANRHHDG